MIKKFTASTHVRDMMLRAYEERREDTKILFDRHYQHSKTFDDSSMVTIWVSKRKSSDFSPGDIFEKDGSLYIVRKNLELGMI